MKTREMPTKLQAWLKQPGTFVTDAECSFIENIRRLADCGIGYGFMQQVIEWEWQDKANPPGSSWGPESHGARIAELERQLSEKDAWIKRLLSNESEAVKNLHAALDTEGVKRRDLERQLAEAKAERDRLNKLHQEALVLMKRAADERDSAEDDRDRLRRELAEATECSEKLRLDVLRVEDQAAAMKQMLLRIADQVKLHCGSELYHELRDALATDAGKPLLEAARQAKETMEQAKVTCQESQRTFEAHNQKWDAHSLCLRTLPMIEAALKSLEQAGI